MDLVRNSEPATVSLSNVVDRSILPPDRWGDHTGYYARVRRYAWVLPVTSLVASRSLMTATAEAPAARTAGALSSVMPPMATRGMAPATRAAAVTRSRPTAL